MNLLESLWEDGLRYKKTNNEQYEKILIQILNTDCNLTEENMKLKELSILALGDLYSKLGFAVKIQDLIFSNKILFSQFPKAKTAKVIKILIEYVSKIENTQDIQIELCLFLVKWCQEEKRTYLRHRIEIKLAYLYWQKQKFNIALELIDALLLEVRKTDDKHLLVEIELVESKIHHSLENVAKAKSSLTATRANANSIYCPPLIQADIDLMTGILQAEDNDYKTSYSYFYEAFEALNSNEDFRAINALKYMLLSKIMTNSVDEAYAILNGKYGLKYAGKQLEAMRSIAEAYNKKSLRSFQNVLQQYQKEITVDPIIKLHTNNLYENLLEQNLFRIIRPYSKVQIDYISNQINLGIDIVQKKLSELILDKKIDGTLDQGNGCLIIFNDLKCDNLYENSLGTLSNLNLVLDKLFEKTNLIKH